MTRRRAFLPLIHKMSPRTQKVYFLSKDCFVCCTQNYWIILNVGRDKYSCVTDANLASIGHRLYGWEGGRTDNEHVPESSAADEKMLAALLSNSIITSIPTDGKAFKESTSPARMSATEIPEAAVRERIQPLCVVRFFLACARVDWQLRTKGLSRALARLERRRRRPDASVLITPNSSMRMAAFQKLRPWYPRAYLCLFDSLVLLEFLASYRVFPRIVFGVVADPFQAHCWLQEGEVVINDTLERVCIYTPILCI
jgi:hypothetical protein